MRFRKLRLAMLAVFGIAFWVLVHITFRDFERHQNSIYGPPYVDQCPDWDRYLYWIPVMAVAAIAPVLPWPERFSLRALLIATTLIAVVLTLIVWLIK